MKKPVIRSASYSAERIDLSLPFIYKILETGERRMDRFRVPDLHRYLLKGINFRYTSIEPFSPERIYKIHNFLDNTEIKYRIAGRDWIFSYRGSSLFDKNIKLILKKDKDRVIQRLYCSKLLLNPIILDLLVDSMIEVIYLENSLAGDRFYIELFGFDERAI